VPSQGCVTWQVGLCCKRCGSCEPACHSYYSLHKCCCCCPTLAADAAPQVFNNAVQCLSEEDRALPPILKILPMLQVGLVQALPWSNGRRSVGSSKDRVDAQSVGISSQASDSHCKM